MCFIQLKAMECDVCMLYFSETFHCVLRRPSLKSSPACKKNNKKNQLHDLRPYTLGFFYMRQRIA